jgi:SRSO17 transposase
MFADGFAGFLSILDTLRPAFTTPSVNNLVVLFVGWVLSSGPHAVTQALVATGVPGRRHHEAFHRFFSRGTWNPDRVGHLLFDKVLAKLVPRESAIGAVVDDTLATKKGPEVFGIGSHLDPVRSTKAFRVFAFGHVWVVLAIVVAVPFSRRPWALPVLFRLYRNKKECAKNGGRYRKKTELAREMVNILASWAPERRIEVAADSAYCNATVLKGLPERIVVFGDMRPDAVLTAEPPKRGKGRRGRRPVRGRLLPKPRVLAADQRRPWRKCEVKLYGTSRTIYFKTLDAQWYRACGSRLIRIVVVRVDTGKDKLRVFFCTETGPSPHEILQTYARRWSIEVCFRDLKQQLGFADSSARKKEAVARTAPFVGFIYTSLVLWFAEGIWTTHLATPPLRPWYRHKQGLCFADVVRAAQRLFMHIDVLDPERTCDNLRELLPPSRSRPPQRAQPQRRAA